MDKHDVPESLFGLPPEKGRWIFLFLALCITTCLGAIYAYSVFKEPLRERFGLTATQGNLPFMLFIAVFSAGTFFSGRFIDRHGPGGVMRVGSLLMGFGWMLARFSTGIGSLVLSYSLVGGFGVGIVYGGPVAVAARWFPDKKGLAVGLALAGFGLSAFVTAPIARHLIEQPGIGVLNTFGLMGAGFLVILLSSAGMLRAGPGDTLLYALCFCGFWLCLGGWLAIAPAATAGFFGMDGYAGKYGLVFLAYGLGAILGGMLSGIARDAFGSYTAAFLPAAALGVLGLLLAAALLRPPAFPRPIPSRPV